MRTSTMELTLRNSQKFEFELDSRIAEAVAMHHQDGGVFFSIEGKECFSVDFKNVLAIQVSPGEEAEKKEIASYSPEPLISHSYTSVDSQKAKAVYKIECKCGAEYFAKLFSDTTGCRCRECNERVSVDAFAPKKMNEYNEPATLITNRYRVGFASPEAAENDTQRAES